MFWKKQTVVEHSLEVQLITSMHKASDQIPSTANTPINTQACESQQLFGNWQWRLKTTSQRYPNRTEKKRDLKSWFLNHGAGQRLEWSNSAFKSKGRLQDFPLPSVCFLFWKRPTQCKSIKTGEGNASIRWKATLTAKSSWMLDPTSMSYVLSKLTYSVKHLRDNVISRN